MESDRVTSSHPQKGAPRQRFPCYGVSDSPNDVQEEILALYQEVSQLKRDNGEVQCLEDAVEETHIETLEVLKAHLWHVGGVPAQPGRA